MSKHDDDIAGSQPASGDTPQLPQQPGRRRFLGSMAALSAGSTAYTFRSRNFFGQAYDERGPSILDCSRSTKEQRPRNPRFSQIMVRANGAEIFLSRGNTRGVSNGACLGRD
jgi:hypothetical protein